MLVHCDDGEANAVFQYVVAEIDLRLGLVSLCLEFAGMRWGAPHHRLRIIAWSERAGKVAKA